MSTLVTFCKKIYNFKTVRIVIDDDLPKYMSKFPESLAIEKLNHFETKEIAEKVMKVREAK